MTLYDIISMLQYALVGLCLVLSLLMLQRGMLSERFLRLGPTRDLHLPRAVYFIGTCLVMGYAVLMLQADSESPQAVRQLLELIPVVIIALFVGLTMRVEAGFRKVGLLPRHPMRDMRWGLIGGVIGFGLAGAAGILASWVTLLLKQPAPEVSHETLVQLRENFSVQLLIAIIVSAVLIGPLFEEIVFRGVLQTSLMRLMHGRRWLALLLSATVFSAIHAWVVPIQALAPLFVLGLVFGYLYERTGSLLTPIVAHSVFNATNIAIAISQP